MRRPHGSASPGLRETWSSALRVLACLTAAELGAAVGPVLAQGAWQPLETLPTPRRLLAAAAYGGKIYTFGGCGSPCFDPPLHTSTREERTVEVYDPVTREWATKRPLPAIVFGAAAAAPKGDTIYLVGGFVTGGDTWAYDPGRDAWTPRARMPTPRHGLAVVALNGKVWAIGGSDGRTASRALEVYDPATNVWQQKAPMQAARVFLAAAAVGDKIYAIGGSPDGRGTSATAVVEVYDPETDRWTPADPLPVALQVSAAAVIDGRIYVAGGFIPGRGSRAFTFEYDPLTGRWTELSPEPPLRVARDQAPAVALGRSVHLLGGSTDCHCRALADHDAFTPRRREDPEDPIADLHIEKNDGLDVACPGDRITYTITVTNDGPADVKDATVKDQLSAKLSGATWTCTASPGASCTLAGTGSIADETVDLPAHATVTYRLTATVRTTATGTITNRASVEAPSGVIDEGGNNTTLDATGVVPPPGVFVTKASDPATAVPGDRLLYRITVGTIGHVCPAPAVARVVDPLTTTGLEDVRWCSGEDCEPSIPGDLEATVTLLARETATFMAAGTVPCDCLGGPSMIENTAAVSDLSGRLLAAATERDPVAPPPNADLVLALAGPGEVEAGDTTAPYTFTVSNPGPCTAPGTKLEIAPPAGFELVSIAPPCAGFPECGLGDLPAGSPPSTVTAVFSVPADHACPQTVPINADVSSSCPGRDAGVLETTVECIPPPPQEIRASCGAIAGPPLEGSMITFSLVIENDGPVDQGDNPGPELEAALPAGLALVSAVPDSGAVTIAGDTVRWDGPIPAGAIVTITITATIDAGTAGTTLCVHGTVFFDQDGDGVNESSRPAEAPCCLLVDPPMLIPTLADAMLALLALALAALAVARLAKHG